MINSLLNAFIHFSERFHEKIYFCHAFRPKAPLCDVRQKKTNTNFQNFKTGNPIEKNPHFKQILPKHEQTSQQKDNPEPMDVDPSSSKFRQPTNYQSGNNYQKRQNSERMSARKFQKINYIAEDSEPYEEMAENEVLDIEQESEVNFLGESPSYLSSNEC